MEFHPVAPTMLILLALLTPGCKSRACEDRPAEVQIDVSLAGINAAEVAHTEVGLLINEKTSLAWTRTKARGSLLPDPWSTAQDRSCSEKQPEGRVAAVPMEPYGATASTYYVCFSQPGRARPGSATSRREDVRGAAVFG